MRKLCGLTNHLVLLLLVGVKYSGSVLCYTVHWDTYWTYTQRIYDCNEPDAYCAASYDDRAEEFHLRAVPLDQKCYTVLELRGRINCNVSIFEEGCFMDANYSSCERSSEPLPVCICKGDYCNTPEKIENIWLQRKFYESHNVNDCGNEGNTKNPVDLAFVKSTSRSSIISTPEREATEVSKSTQEEDALVFSSVNESFMWTTAKPLEKIKNLTTKATKYASITERITSSSISVTELDHRLNATALMDLESSMSNVTNATIFMDSESAVSNVTSNTTFNTTELEITQPSKTENTVTTTDTTTTVISFTTSTTASTTTTRTIIKPIPIGSAIATTTSTIALLLTIPTLLFLLQI